MQEDYSIAALCDAMKVSRSGCHAWVTREPQPRAKANATLRTQIEEVYQQTRSCGAPRILQWRLCRDLVASLLLRALEMALTHRQPPRGPVHHSDRRL